MSEVKFTRTTEEWSNGLTCRWFEVLGVEYKLSHNDGSKHDPEQYSYISVAEPNQHGGGVSTLKNHPFRHMKRFDGLISPIAATEIIHMCVAARALGHSEGYGSAQQNIREALGL